MQGTVKSHEDVDRLFTHGERTFGKMVMARIAKTPEGRDHSGRVAFIAGKRLGNAVLRNRCKRVMREAVRMAGGPWPGYDVAFIARSAKLAKRSPYELVEECKALVGSITRS